ncbi:MAG: hypothetical protein R3F34_06270 [Planctomycetota bacterium]
MTGVDAEPLVEGPRERLECCFIQAELRRPSRREPATTKRAPCATSGGSTGSCVRRRTSTAVGPRRRRRFEYRFEVGPDGRRYAVSAETDIAIRDGRRSRRSRCARAERDASRARTGAHHAQRSGGRHARRRRRGARREIARTERELSTHDDADQRRAAEAYAEIEREVVHDDAQAQTRPGLPTSTDTSARDAA